MQCTTQHPSRCCPKLRRVVLVGGLGQRREVRDGARDVGLKQSADASNAHVRVRAGHPAPRLLVAASWMSTPCFTVCSSHADHLPAAASRSGDGDGAEREASDSEEESRIAHAKPTPESTSTATVEPEPLLLVLWCPSAPPPLTFTVTALSISPPCVPRGRGEEGGGRREAGCER